MPTDRLTVEICRSHFSKEAFDLYNDYNIKKFEDSIVTEYSYCEHVVNTPTTHQVIDGIEYGTFHHLYRLDGKLVAVEVVDVIPKGMVSVYMWYDVNKEIAKYSFGVYSVLNDIEINQWQNTWVLASPVHMHLPPRALDLFFCLADYNLKRKLLAFVRFISLSHKVNNREATFCYLFVYS